MLMGIRGVMRMIASETQVSGRKWGCVAAPARNCVMPRMTSRSTVTTPGRRPLAALQSSKTHYDAEDGHWKVNQKQRGFAATNSDRKEKEKVEAAREKARESADAAKQTAGAAQQATKEAVDAAREEAKESSKETEDATKETLRTAKEKAGEAADATKQKAEGVKEAGKESLEAAKEEAGQAADAAKQRAEQLKETGKETLDAAKEKAAQAADRTKQTAEGLKNASKETKDAAKEKAREAAEALKSKADATSNATAETIGQAPLPQNATTTYAAVAGMHGAVATGHVLSPYLASEFIFQTAMCPFDPIQAPLHRLLGTGHLAAAWTAWVLKGGAGKRQLHMPEFQRLNLGLAFFALATLGIHAVHWDMLRPAAALTAATIAGITAAAPAFYYSRTSGHGLRAFPVAEGIMRDLGNLMQIRGVKSATYAALTVAILGAGSGYVISPQESLHNVLPNARGPENVMLWRAIGAALFMLPTWTVNLKEAADVGALYKPQFLDLNMGLAMTGLPHLVVLTPWWLYGYSGPLMPYVLGTWATAFAVGTWGALAHKPEPVGAT